MRRLISICIILLLIVGGSILAAAFLVPKQTYKTKIEEQASAILGRKVEINGDISLKIFPRIAARAFDVRIENAKGFHAKDFAKMDEMRVGVALLPLFSKHVEITEFVLIRPQISLEKRKNNAVNWALGSGATTKTRANANKGFVRAPGALTLNASLGDVRIEDGQAIYHDQTTNKKTSLNAINLSLKLPDLDKKMVLAGRFMLNGAPYSLHIDLASLRALLGGEETATNFKINSDLINFSFAGHFAKSKNLDFTGTMDLDIPSVQNLAKANGKAFQARPDTFGRFSINGDVKGSPKRLSFQNANLQFDQIKAAGAFGAYFKGKTPKLTGKLQIDELDITPYLPPQPPKGTDFPPWPETPFSIEALQAANVNFTLNVAKMRVRNIEFGQSNLKGKLLNGRLEANLSETHLYGGTGTGKVVINARTQTPSFSFQGDLKQVQALALFQAAAEFKRIDGMGDVQFDIQTTGNSVAQMMRQLSGTTDLQLRDGAIIGVNLASVLRSAQNYLLTGALPQQLGSREQTDFSSLRGHFDLNAGVARNTDMLMSGPLLRVTGNGEVDFGQQSLDYHLVPKAVASLKGQDGKADLNGLSAPFRMHGPWNAIKAGIDTKVLQKRVAKRAKQEASKLIKDNVGGPLGDVLQGLLNKDQAKEPTPENTATENKTKEPEPQSDEEKALDILGGLFGFGSPTEEQPETEPEETEPEPQTP